MFADRLRTAMEIRGMKAIELSEKLNVNKGTISAYMNGKIEPRSLRVYDIARVLRVKESWLLGYDVPMDRDIDDLVRTEIKMMEEFNALSFEQQETVRTLISTLYAQNKALKKQA